MKFYIITLGCKVNTYESEIIKEKLLKDGFLEADEENDADIIIINTCTVTNMADNKSKKMVRHAKRLGRVLVVCGCSAENKEDEYKTLDIDILIGNNEKSKINEHIKNYLKSKEKYEKFYHSRDIDFENMQIEKFSSLTRAFVKIQDGCNNFCSYCIIPYVRGNIRSKDYDTTIKEIKTLVDNGHYEIVLTGIHTGSYENNNHDLADLITEISKIENLKRIRISSIEVTELNDKMLDIIKNNDKVANHFHIPLQAGSDEILKRMNRKYDLEYFKNKVKQIKAIKDDVSITTDVIVGHPYETEELFLQTIETCKDIDFSKIHVFPYSKREGTPASRMPMQIDDVDKKQRSKILNQLSHELERKYAVGHLNKVVEVLIEQVYENECIGSTSNYLKIKILKPLKKNNFYNVKIIAYKNDFLIGEIL